MRFVISGIRHSEKGDLGLRSMFNTQYTQFVLHHIQTALSLREKIQRAWL